jgi:archaemetzincin
MSAILVVPIGPLPPELLTPLPLTLEQAFHLPVRLDPKLQIDPSAAFDESRNQYYSTRLISFLLDQIPAGGGKILGVCSSDLFVPVLTYVFGEAQLNGRVAVVSSYRLDDERYGLPQNQPLLQERLVKEAVHELGHTFGLVHCHNQDCVMHSSSGVEEIDLKSSAFCESCRSVLGEECEKGITRADGTCGGLP